MTDGHRFLAMDLGAESGRGMLVTLREGKVEAEEIHRFPNRRVPMAGTLHWDFPFLYAEILEALRICARREEELSGISVDTWGVDFGLLGRDGKLLGNPVSYRDPRTEGIHEKARARMPIEEIFAETALHTMPINTLYQLHAMQLNDSPQLDVAETLLMMPDLFAYFLTGVRASELTIAQTSQLVDRNCRWSERIIQAFDLPEKIFPNLIGPAEVVGPLLPEVRDATGIGDVPVIASAGHDTGAAVSAVPGEGENWAFMSSGTWSIMGMLVDEAVNSPAAYERGFTNEVAYGGWYFARNILGLWLVQQLRAKWDTPDAPWDYDRMTSEAAKAESGPLVNVDDGSLMSPPDMEDALLALLKSSGQEVPETRGELVRCVLESLALLYGWGMEQIEELTGAKPESLYIVGGGIHNKLLCQLTANACGVPVHAGADQCTAMGNALGQALALGILASPEEVRTVMRNSFEVVTYEPKESDAWAEKRSRFAKLHAKQSW